MRKTLLCQLLVFPMLLRSADTSLSGPIAGYLADPSRPILRVISGVPGAYQFSDPVALPEGVTRIHMAPGSDYALIENGSLPPAVLFLTGGAVDHVAALSAVMPAADWVAFSNSASAAVLYSAAAQRLQLLTGLPSAPQLALDLDASTFPEQPLYAAASDDGALVLIASGNSVYTLPPAAPPRLLLSAGRIESIAILRNGADAVVSDSSTASVRLLPNAASSADTQVLVSDLQSIGKLYPAADGSTLFIAQPGAQAVSSLDLDSGNLQTFPLPAAPSELFPLRNRDTFLVSAKSGQPGAVFFRDDSHAVHAVFIPAIVQGAAQ